MDCELFFTKLGDGVFQISDFNAGPNEDGFSLLPGRATANSYLIVGEKRAMLIDLAVPSPKLFDFALEISKRNMDVFLTHGHPDHVYFLDEVSRRARVFVSKEDESLVLNGMPGICEPLKVKFAEPFLTDGQVIDLGQRKVKVIKISGHTMGSVLFLDEKTKLLIAGDTCARRLLYGLSKTVPLGEHIRLLKELKNQDFDLIYTAHDRCALKKSHIDLIVSCIENDLKSSNEKINLPGCLKMLHFSHGDENSLDYFDIAILEEYI